MKGVVITPEMDVNIQDFGEPLHKTVGEVVGGSVEHVRPIGLSEPYCMYVNEDGLMYRLPVNPVGCYLYGTSIYGIPIVGTIVIFKDGFWHGERDTVGLSDEEAERFCTYFRRIVEPVRGKQNEN